MVSRPSLYDQGTWRRARRDLIQRDPVFANAIRRLHVAAPHRPRSSRFALLAHAILSQQISGKAAATIRRRLKERLEGRWTPTALLELGDEDFTLCGVSRQKRDYLRDLATRESDGSLKLRSLHLRDDEEVIEILTRIKGVGRWTAEMFLIFVLGRTDVLAVDDLGLQNAVRNLHGLAERPGPEQFRRIAEVWKPWRSIASWYLWATLGGPEVGG